MIKPVRRRLVFVLVAAAASLGILSGAAAGQPNTATSVGAQLSPDVCLSTYGAGNQKVVGKQTVYDRSASLYQVCEGFGAPDKDGFHLTPTMQCAIIAAVATFGGPVVNVGVATGCGGGDVYGSFQAHKWLGLAKGVACGYFGDIFAGAVGVFTAGAASATGSGGRCRGRCDVQGSGRQP